jgi:cytochrome c biogenesis protein CcmG/thiol:disulfide interchange protein DsbE
VSRLLRIGVFAALLALLTLLGWGVFRQPTNVASPLAGKRASDFALETFDGRRISLSQFRGHPVVLNFWASWCIPCRAEMPYFERIYREYRDRGVVFVGLAVQDDPQAAQDFLLALGVTYPTGMDRRNDAATSYSLVGLPTTIFITPEATVAKRWNGPVSEDQLTALVKEMVKPATISLT